jgi:uncharacterized protein (TIGR02145 family)
MENIRPRTKSELKKLYTNLRSKGITDDMMSDLIEACYNENPNSRTSGFETPGGTDAVMSFDPALHIFTIAPFDPVIENWQPRYGIYTWAGKPVFHRLFETIELELPDTEGLYLLYFDINADTRLPELLYVHQPTEAQAKEIYLTRVIVTWLYWDYDNQELIHFGDDRHGSEWQPQMQRYLHLAFGARRKSGLQFADYTINGDGSSNTHAQFSITAGTMLHDDIELAIPGISNTLPVLYCFGGLPRFLLNTGYAIAEGGRVYFNNAMNNIAQADSGNFVLYHIFATNEIAVTQRKTISVMGTAQYTDLADAYKGVEPELDGIYTYMPMQGRCYLGTVVVQTSDDYTNAVHARIVAITGNAQHPPVSIGSGSEEYLEINEKQVLKYIPNAAIVDAIARTTGWNPGAWGVEVEPSFDDGSREFTLTAIGSTFGYFVQGIWYTKSEAESIAIANTTGMHFIVYNGANLEEITLDEWLQVLQYKTKCLVAAIYWNATEQKAILKSAEPHTHTISGQEHYRVHTSEGTRYAGGLGLSIHTNNWQLNVEEGTIIDEDIPIVIQDDITTIFGQNLTVLESLKLYRFGLGAWKYDDTIPANIVYLSSGNKVYHNVNTGGTWSLAETAVNRFSAMWVVATNDWDNPVVMVMGQGDAGTLKQAQDGNLLADMNFSGLPTAEFRILGRVIVKCIAASPFYENVEIESMQADDIKPGGDITTDSYVIGASYDSNTHILTLTRNNGLPTVTVEITGIDGNDGREVEISTDNNYIVWRYVGETVWNNICPVPKDGSDGVGISSITLISTVGLVKTYRITYTDSTTFDFEVTDGADGTGGSEPTVLKVNSGALYNPYVLSDVRNIANTGWRVATEQDWNDMILATGEQFGDGMRLCSKNKADWDGGAAGSNETGLTLKITNERSGETGAFIYTSTSNTWGNEPALPNVSFMMSISPDSIGYAPSTNLDKSGRAIRLVKDTSDLNQGETGIYVGNDGKTYKTINITGLGVEWMAEPLCETKYRNGDWVHGFDGGVYTPISNVDWVNLTSEAMCFMDDDEAIGYEFITISEKTIELETRIETLEACCEEVQNNATVQVPSLVIFSSGWVLSGDLYEYDLYDSHITDTSIVDVIPDNTNNADVVAAGMLPQTDSFTGYVKLYAVSVPTVDLSVSINIFKATLIISGGGGD